MDMTSMYAQFLTDPEAERKGVWVEYSNFRVRLARAGGANKKFQKISDFLTRPFRRAIQTETIDLDRAILLAKEIFSKACITDWEVKVEGEWKQGIEAPDGSLLSFTPENVLETLKMLNDIFLDLQDLASKMTLYKAEINEADSEN